MRGIGLQRAGEEAEVQVRSRVVTVEMEDRVTLGTHCILEVKSMAPPDRGDSGQRGMEIFSISRCFAQKTRGTVVPLKAQLDLGKGW